MFDEIQKALKNTDGDVVKIAAILELSAAYADVYTSDWELVTALRKIFFSANHLADEGEFASLQNAIFSAGCHAGEFSLALEVITHTD